MLNMAIVLGVGADQRHLIVAWHARTSTSQSHGQCKYKRTGELQKTAPKKTLAKPHHCHHHGSFMHIIYHLHQCHWNLENSVGCTNKKHPIQRQIKSSTGTEKSSPTSTLPIPKQPQSRRMRCHPGGRSRLDPLRRMLLPPRMEGRELFHSLPPPSNRFLQSLRRSMFLSSRLRRRSSIARTLEGGSGPRG